MAECAARRMWTTFSVVRERVKLLWPPQAHIKSAYIVCRVRSVCGPVQFSHTSWPLMSGFWPRLGAIRVRYLKNVFTMFYCRAPNPYCYIRPIVPPSYNIVPYAFSVCHSGHSAICPMIGRIGPDGHGVCQAIRKMCAYEVACILC